MKQKFLSIPSFNKMYLIHHFIYWTIFWMIFSTSYMYFITFPGHWNDPMVILLRWVTWIFGFCFVPIASLYSSWAWHKDDHLKI